MPETYVVTGAAGFIGSHIAERLLRDGARVRVIDNLLTGKCENLDFLKSLGGDLSITIGSITDGDIMREICRGADYVLHQAALPSVPRSIAAPLETHKHCVTGTLNVLIAARDAGVSRVVYAASGSAYGDQAGATKVETMLPAPISPYGAAKLIGEYYAAAFCHSYGLETVSLRYFNVFGPRQDPTSTYAAAIPKFISLMLRGEQPAIYGDGEQTRDFTYVENIARGNLLACAAPDAVGETINLATGGQVAVNHLVAQLNKILGTDLAPIHAAERPGDIKHSRADIAKARHLLGFAPTVSFEEGLRRTVDWYRAYRRPTTVA
ncbi:MAG: SDR family oxidoreductase [Chloroflexota bacterium]|nr:SDR family oxidoreductase [Chloroflexota bacterium]MDE2946504.1 SDR family oxidoreductase [Chloroflexota bacterium]